ncbi:hypothetical protein PMIN04_007565 [Paraphaeosphaeria minitans]|uniref:Uncharacterized protein n=1 Tax=Paraphaeosphaeria minitans TaxID=565426 RepID=A0A9P6KLW4_9PLEO|nr:hypothetical protein PMIN01_10334 [Paraphaeosphaeria minitans]
MQSPRAEREEMPLETAGDQSAQSSDSDSDSNGDNNEDNNRNNEDNDNANSNSNDNGNGNGNDNDNGNGDSDTHNGAAHMLRISLAAEKIADLLHHLKRELATLDATAAVETRGSLQVVLKTYGDNINMVKYDDVMHTKRPSVCMGPLFATDGDEPPVNGVGTDFSDAITIDDDGTVTATGAATVTGATTAPLSKRTRRASDAELEKDLVSRKRQRLDRGKSDANDPTDDDDIMPLITKEHLQNIVANLRDDIQEDTSESVNHVQRLLRRFKEEWHEKSTWDFAQAAKNQNARPSRRSIDGNGTTPAAAFPSPGANQDDDDITVPDLIRQESKLISSQIKWVEDCRRLAADAHGKREENWRTSSASFHDKARQERESFQGRLLHEQGMQSQTLSQILNEVKSFGLYVQSMKWETPGSVAMGPPYMAGPPAFPTQPPPPPSRGRGRPRGSGRRV